MARDGQTGDCEAHITLVEEILSFSEAPAVILSPPYVIRIITVTRMKTGDYNQALCCAHFLGGLVGSIRRLSKDSHL